MPLQEFPQARAAFEIHNSPLSENATVGFEFGYNVQEPKRLVIWEAQYGDFINGAQVMLDQFVTSGRAKWGLTPSLVFLLPHGYEGQGPEHSSARPERFLEAAADINLRLVNCTTAAQYFHLLRRQAALLERDPLPLVRADAEEPAASSRRGVDAARAGRRAASSRSSTTRMRAAGRATIERARAVQRQGLRRSDRAASGAPRATDIAICRVEQLYPFPNVALAEVLERYPSVRDVVWVQEEPENMGAWEFVRPLLEELIGDRCPLRYIGRARSSSPSEGSSAWHQLNQKALVEQAFDLGSRALGAVDGAVEAGLALTALQSVMMPTSSFPQLGESVVEARVARWLKKEGDRVEVGEPLVELETEKIDLEVNAERARRASPASRARKART